MKTKVHSALCISHSALVLALLSTLSPQPSAFGQGTAFSYQGRLNDGGAPANGNYDLQFYLRDALTGGNPVGATNSLAPVAVNNGQFAVTLDFGTGIFTGPARWLEIGVRPNGSVTAYTTLAPRQPLLATPYAITASNLTGTLPAAQLSGPLPSAALTGAYPGAVALNNPANSFSGNGTGLTNVNAATLGGLAGTNFWQTGGNTVNGNQFLGTLNNQPLELKANGSRVARYEPNANGAPNAIGGAGVNFVTPGTVGAVIAGGGATNYSGSPYTNSVSGDFGHIGGGAGNSIVSGPYSSIVGGNINSIHTGNSFVGGGNGNNIYSGSGSVIGGGYANTMPTGYSPAPDSATIGGGQANTAGRQWATVPGGGGNSALGRGSFAAGIYATAADEGAFVWSDFSGYQSTSYFSSTSSNQFLIRATGGVGINTNNPRSALHVNGTVTATNFVGSGAGLTGLSGAAIAGGSIGNAALAGGAVNAPNIAGGQVVKSLNGLNDAVTLSAGPNVTLLVTNGTNIQISATGGSGSGWNLAGNSGTAAGVNFLGTTDNQPLELKVNAARAFRLQPTWDSPNVVGGYSGNAAAPGVAGATIAGGGTPDNNSDFNDVPQPNTINANWATIGGGVGNTAGAGADYSTIAGGVLNSNQDDSVLATISGGELNVVRANAVAATIGGGAQNTAAGQESTVPGGALNSALGNFSFAAGYRAKATNQGAFVWADSQNADFSSTATNQFLIRANGGVGINTNNPQSALHVNGTVTATNFAGSGAGLTGLSGASLADGSITSAKLESGAAAANLQAGGQAAVPSGGAVLSTDPGSANLANAGYVRIGQFGLGGDTWAQISAPMQVSGAPAARGGHTAVWTGSEMIVWGGYGSAELNDGGRYNPTVNGWTAIPSSLANTPAARSDHTAVWTGSEMIVWGGVNGSGELNDGGRYNPTASTWTAIPNSLANTPVARGNYTVVWSTTTGEMIVWGGSNDSGYLNDGGRYSPSANTWTAIPNSLANTPAVRQDHTAVWTGSEMVVWGGWNESGQRNDGGRYNPSANAWTAIPSSLANTPAARYSHTAVWTGSQMVVWGGQSISGYLNDGGRYDPSANTWTAILNSLANTPAARGAHTAVWTGSQMVVWAGYGGSGYLNDGGRYSPSANSWTATATAGGPAAARYAHTAVWTGGEMIVWGGQNGSGPLNDGGRYSASGNSWQVSGAPAARGGHTAVWTGSEMIVWGGYGSAELNDGGRYNPTVNGWTAIPSSLANTPAARSDHTAVWTGSEMIVWGGVNGSGELNDGGRYNPTASTWTAIPNSLANTPVARGNYTVVWSTTTGEMIVWGGSNDSGYLNDGGRYSPSANTWTAIPNSLANTPAVRQDHTAVWTGSEMVVWGGWNESGQRNDGGRYNPSANAWTAIPSSLANTPAARYSHTAVWTGSQMVVWGGQSISGYLNDGGRYDPSANTWTAILNSLANTPAARGAHTAVWTGSQMVVWAGYGGSGYLNDGGRYSPSANSWTATATAGGPAAARYAHTAVWTGGEMIVWGGQNGSGPLNDGGRYSAPVNMYVYLKP